MADFPETRDTPGGGMEVLDADGIWRTVPFALHEFMRSYKPSGGFTVWEWKIGQVYAAGMFPPNGTAGSADDDEVARRFMRACEARFPDQCQKFADYMGWKRRVKPQTETEQ